FSKESRKTIEMYGAEPGKASYANNCLLARRLVERGTRFVQLYHTDWDHHADLGQPLEQVAREIDRPTAALIRDLKERGLLEHTKLTFKFQGRNFRLTDVSGQVIQKLLA